MKLIVLEISLVGMINERKYKEHLSRKAWDSGTWELRKALTKAVRNCVPLFTAVLTYWIPAFTNIRVQIPCPKLREYVSFSVP
jgi:hypothetical protein